MQRCSLKTVRVKANFYHDNIIVQFYTVEFALIFLCWRPFMIWWSYFHTEKIYWNQIEILYQPKNGLDVHLTVCQRGSNVVSFFEWNDKLHHFILPIEVPFKEIWNSTPTHFVQIFMFWHLWFKKEGQNKSILVNTTYLVKFLEAWFDHFVNRISGGLAK